MIRKFYWSQKDDEKRIHGLGFERLCINMRFCNMKACNLALLAKQG